MAFFKILNRNLPHHVIAVPASRDFNFNYEALETALKRAGASENEAEALLELLHDIGWGGLEFPPPSSTHKDFTFKELKQILKWYRTRYFDRKIQPRKTQLDQFHEDINDYHQKKLFDYHSPNQHFSHIRNLKGKKLE